MATITDPRKPAIDLGRDRLNKAKDNMQKQFPGFGTNASTELFNAQSQLNALTPQQQVSAVTSRFGGPNNAILPNYNDPLANRFFGNQRQLLSGFEPIAEVGLGENQAFKQALQGIYQKQQQDLERNRQGLRSGVLASEANQAGLLAGLGSRQGASNAQLLASQALAGADTRKQLGEVESNYLANRTNQETQFLNQLGGINQQSQALRLATLGRQVEGLSGVDASIYARLAADQEAARNRALQAQQIAAQTKKFQDMIDANKNNTGINTGNNVPSTFQSIVPTPRIIEQNGIRYFVGEDGSLIPYIQ